MSRRFSIIAALVVSLSFIGVVSSVNLHSILSTAVAQKPANKPPKAKQGCVKDLNLTTEQLKQIQAIRKKSKGNITQKRQAIQKAKQELETLMASTTPQAEVRKKYNLLKTLRQELNDAQFENTLAIREVLNSEQRRKYASHVYKNNR